MPRCEFGAPRKGTRGRARPLLRTAHVIILLLLAAGPARAKSGDLDTGFGEGGRVHLQVEGAESRGHAIAIQDDGKILLGGEANGDWALARFRPDGSLDPGFGIDGARTLNIQGWGDVCQALALQADGKILAAGYGKHTAGMDVIYTAYLVRFGPGGGLDLTFHGDGKTSLPFANALFFGMDLQADGKIVAAGHSGGVFPSSNDLLVARFDASGQLDTTFDLDGYLNTDFDGSGDYARAVAVQIDGKIVVAGLATASATGKTDFALARYNDDGTLNLNFGTGGKVTTPFEAGNNEYASGIALQPDGKIVAAGESCGFLASLGQYCGFAVARYNPDGTLDEGFATAGKALTLFFDLVGVANEARATSVAIQDDGSIVVGGYIRYGGVTRHFALARYTAAGTLDQGFGSGGRVITAFGGDDWGQAVAIQEDGKILVGGDATYTPEPMVFVTEMALARFCGDDASTWAGRTWSWSDPERNDAYTVSDPAVTVTATPQQDTWNCSRGKAPLFSFALPASASWLAEVKITVPLHNPATMAGLALWDGQEQGTTHMLYAGPIRTAGTPQVIVEGSIPENCAGYFHWQDLNDASVIVRARRSGNAYTFSYRLAAGPWQTLGAVQTAAAFTRLGFLVKSWSTDGLEAEFSEFKFLLPGSAAPALLLLGEP